MANNIEPNYNEILLLALAEPTYSRVEFWQNKQKQSEYSKAVFYKRLKDVLDNYEIKIETEIEVRNSWGNNVTDFRIPLLFETNQKLTGHLGKPEIKTLQSDLTNFFNSCLSIQDKINYYKDVSISVVFNELYHSVFTVCNWVKPIFSNIDLLKYIEYFLKQIDFDRIENNNNKTEILSNCSAIYYGLEQLLNVDISKEIQNYQNNISKLTNEQIQETQLKIIELIGNLKRQTRNNEKGISFSNRFNLLITSIETKDTLFNIDYQILIAHFNETISNDLLSSFEILNETLKEIAPLIQDKTTNTQPNKEQKIEAPVFEPKLFKDLFNKPEIIDKCLSLLRETEPPCINEDNQFIGKNKGIFIVWFIALQHKKVFNFTFTNDVERAATLKYNFEGLNISESLFRQPNKRAKEIYQNYFNNEIAAIKH